jgi:hypothetical protein
VSLDSRSQTLDPTLSEALAQQDALAQQEIKNLETQSLEIKGAMAGPPGGGGGGAMPPGGGGGGPMPDMPPPPIKALFRLY